MDADQAFELEARVLAARIIERQSWVTLAEQLVAFHDEEAWRLLSYEKFTDWLGVPEVGLGRRTAYRLMQAWRWARRHGITSDELAGTDLTKLVLVIGPVENGTVSAQEALHDATVLSRSDLIEKYGGSRQGAARSPAGAVQVECPHCGVRFAVDQTEDGGEEGAEVAC